MNSLYTEPAALVRLGENALAGLRISLAWRSSLTSCRRSLTCCASLLVMPSRTRLSNLIRLTHSSSVCGAQPILGAMDLIVGEQQRVLPSVRLHHPHRTLAEVGENLPTSA
jgi:hypothetical protein